MKIRLRKSGTIVRSCFVAALLCATFILSAGAQGRSELAARAARYVTAWNSMATSMDQSNQVLAELNENVHKNTPRWVLNEPARERRHQLYAKAKAELRAQLKQLEILETEDR